MTEPAGNAKKSLPRRMLGEGFIGLGIVAAIAAAFFVFYVTPQSQYERERIYRSMNDVSRLLDDKAQAAEHAFEVWNCARNPTDLENCKEDLKTKKERIERETRAELPGFSFDCIAKNIICLRPQKLTLGVDPALQHVSLTLEAIARGAQLPYPEAILLIMNTKGEILAGYDKENKWQQFQSLGALIRRTPASQASDLSNHEFGALLKAAQQSGRGAENSVFEGYPARLSRDIGGQSYSIFVAAHQLGRSVANSRAAPPTPLTITINGSSAEADIEAGDGQLAGPTGEAPTGRANIKSLPRPTDGADDKSGETPAADMLYFAYAVPDRVIDGAALRIPSEWTVNLLLILVCALLSIPFLKLFNRNPLKAIRVLDLLAVLIAIMLTVTTVTLLLTAILLRNSIAQDIESELAHIARNVSQKVAEAAGRFDKNDERTELATYIAMGARDWTPRFKDNKELRWIPVSAMEVEKLAPLQSAFKVGASGDCTQNADEDCSKGLWFTNPPLDRKLKIDDRAYFKSWSNGDGKHVQFLRSKSNGKLSWSYVMDEVPAGKLKPVAMDWSRVPPKTEPIADKSTAPAVPSPPKPLAAGSAKPGQGENKSGEQQAASSQRRGFVVSAMPLELRAPIVPRNFSFMIVLNTNVPELLRSPGSEWIGDVQYHSDQPRSLIENVLREARDDPGLAAALWVLRAGSTASGTDEASRLLPINYHGRSHFALVRPVRGMPYSVVALFDRTEAQTLFAQTIAQTFFLCCCWILLCVLVCWITPRAMRLTLDPSRDEAPRPMPLRGRSIWFFPNGLFAHAPDGFRYASEAGLDELILVLVTLGVQGASFFFMPPAYAVLAMGLISLVALVGHYLLIARPHEGGLPAARRRIYIFLAVLLAALALFGAMAENVWGGWILLLVLVIVAIAALANFVLVRRHFHRVADARGTTEVEAGSAHCVAIQRSFLMRAIILLLLVVAVPTMGILSLIYHENLKGYVGASLITAAERIADQRKTLSADIETRFDLTEGMKSELGLVGFRVRTPGWFLSGAVGESKAADRPPVSGLFSVSPVIAGEAASGEVPAGNPLTDMLDIVVGHFVSRTADVHGSGARVLESSDDRGNWLRLVRPQDFAAPGAPLIEPEGNLVLKAGPFTRLSLHPDSWGFLVLSFSLCSIGILFYALIRRVATHLTGLDLDPIKADDATRTALAQLIAENPAKAWEKLEENGPRAAGQRARLLALAQGRTINFCDRGPIQELVRQGYLELTPYVHIADDRLRTYLRHDLPHEEREAILSATAGHDDRWEHMRLPVFVGLGAACVLLAYTSPNAIQLVMSAFLALTALLPLTQDPISRFLGVQRG